MTFTVGQTVWANITPQDDTDSYTYQGPATIRHAGSEGSVVRIPSGASMYAYTRELSPIPGDSPRPASELIEELRTLFTEWDHQGALYCETAESLAGEVETIIERFEATP